MTSCVGVNVVRCISAVNESSFKRSAFAFVHRQITAFTPTKRRNHETTHENIHTAPPLHYRHNIQNNSVRRRK